MKKLFLCVLFSISLVFLSIFLSVSVLAQEEGSTISAKLKSGGSYELFWPLAARKTTTDPLYFLKLWKEKMRGMLIFEPAKKADYEVMLSTKRILEAEKLLQERKEDLVGQTLEKALAKLVSARANFSKSQKSGNDFQSVKINLVKQLSNLDGFLPELTSYGKGDYQGKSNEIREIVEQFLSDIK